MEKAREIPEGPGAGKEDFRCGTVALAGRTNVGKSTLLNRLVGTKIAIETDKPQATRWRVVGIRNLPGAQIVWVDLPGIHEARSLLNRRMVETARRSISDADVVAVVVDAGDPLSPEDWQIADGVSRQGHPWLFCLNKIDRIPKEVLLERVAEIAARYPDRDVVPVSAKTGENLGELERAVVGLLPTSPPLYPQDEVTDQTERALVSEFVREKIYELTGEEIPYRTAVVVDRFTEHPERNLVVVQATILVERDSQKKILIGKNGAKIREIGRRARLALEAALGRRMFLELFVKVSPNWTKDPRRLQELGL
jgi:GTP-binding protein Era